MLEAVKMGELILGKTDGKGMLGGPRATANGIQVEGSWEGDYGSPGEAPFKMGDVT